MRSYLVTGDKDLLDLKKYQNTEIIPIDMFESGTAPLKNGTTNSTFSNREE